MQEANDENNEMAAAGANEIIAPQAHLITFSQ